MIAKNPLISNGLHISDTDCDCIMVLATAQLRNAVSSPLPLLSCPPPLAGSLSGGCQRQLLGNFANAIASAGCG